MTPSSPPRAPGPLAALSRRAIVRRGAIAAASGASAVAAACGTGTPEKTQSSSTKFPAEMQWMPWSAGNAWLVPTYEQVSADFANKYPQTKLTILPPGGDFLTKLQTMITAGTPPNIADVHHGGRVRSLGPAGQVTDLTAFLKKDAYPKTFIGWEPYAWQKKQYGVPWAIQSTAIFYNQQLFDQAGVKYPTDKWTWDDFVEAGKGLTRPDGSVWGAGDQGGSNYQWINAILASFGGGILKADYSTSTLTDANSVAALDFRASWESKQRIRPVKPGDVSGQFTAGEFAMVTSGSWFVANVKQNAESRLLTAKVPWDVAPVPKGRARRAALAHELGIGIPTGVPNVDASWAGVRHLTSPEALTPFAKIGRIIPPDRNLWKDALPADHQPASFKPAFIDVWDEINLEPPFLPRHFPDVDTIWREELDKVWSGDRPAREGAAAAKTRLDQHLAALKRDGLL